MVEFIIDLESTCVLLTRINLKELNKTVLIGEKIFVVQLSFNNKNVEIY